MNGCDVFINCGEASQEQIDKIQNTLKKIAKSVAVHWGMI